MAQAFLTYCALHILVPAHIAVPLTLACFLVGLALGSGLSERIPDHKHAAWLTRAPLAAIPLLLLVGWALFFSNDHIAGFGMVSRGLAIGSAGLFLGTSLGPILPLGLKTLARQIPDLTTWAYASYYLALAAGAFAMQWLARFYGWNTVGNTAGLCFALVCCTGIFLWPPWTRRKKPEESPLN